MKVAIVTEWLDAMGGAEQVLQQMLAIYPDADLYAVADYVAQDKRGFLQGKKVHTSFIQRVPGARRWFRHYLPLMSLAVEQFDLSAYDVVISSHHAVAKSVITGPDQLHVCYCHSPIRYAWDLQHEYLRQSNMAKGVKSALARAILHYVRERDAISGLRPDVYIANSDFIRRRIAKTYRRDATVMYPPVNIDRFQLDREKEDYYITVGRVVPYKRVDLIAASFAQMPERKLLVVGDGVAISKAKQMANGATNIVFLGALPNEEVTRLVAKAKAFVFAAEEDFGISPVEAQAAGTPVIAYGKGGALETVRGYDRGLEKPTGVFFAEQTVESLTKAIEYFESGIEIVPDDCRANAERFAESRFRQELSAFVQQAWDARKVR